MKSLETTIGINGFTVVLGLKTIDTNGFWSGKPLVPMVFQWFLVQCQWVFNGFVVRQPLEAMVFQWFPMVGNHWSNDGMVTIHRCGLLNGNLNFHQFDHKAMLGKRLQLALKTYFKQQRLSKNRHIEILPTAKKAQTYKEI